MLFFAAFIAFACIVLFVDRFVADRFFPWVYLAPALLPLSAGAYAADAECPRCRDTFFRRSGFGNMFSHHCLHCDLSLTPPRAADE